MKYIISTDSTADLKQEFLDKNEIYYLQLGYSIDGQAHTFTDGYPLNEFYERMRAGDIATTTQANMMETKEFFTNFAKQGIDVLHIGFSSALSGSYSVEYMMAQEVMEEYPNVTIKVIDSLAASGGQGLMVLKALEKKNEGYSLQELEEYLISIRPYLTHIFTVESMTYLYRGGRVSKGKAVIANTMNIKPILNCNEEGKLTPIAKAHGRKKSIKEICNLFGQYHDEIDKDDIVLIYDADCKEEGDALESMMIEKYGLTNTKRENIGPTIGAHSGPGTVAIFFLGSKR